MIGAIWFLFVKLFINIYTLMNITKKYIPYCLALIRAKIKLYENIEFKEH